MQLVRFDPFARDSIFRSPFFSTETPRQSGEWLPRVDLFQREGTWVLRAELAGIDPADIDITVEDGLLELKGTRSFEETTETETVRRKEIVEGSFSRKVRLPKGADVENISAHFSNGVVEVTIPMTAEVLPKRIEIDIA